MLTSVRRWSLAVAATASVAACGVAAIPASAQTTQNGLINVSLSNDTVQVPIGVAANICNVSANVLNSAPVTFTGGPCTASAPVTATGGGGGGGGSTTQTGLVNVSVSNTTIQVPVGVAANICNVSANVINSGPVTFTPGGPCDATAPVSAGA
jgi:hypothetical protein